MKILVPVLAMTGCITLALSFSAGQRGVQKDTDETDLCALLTKKDAEALLEAPVEDCRCQVEENGVEKLVKTTYYSKNNNHASLTVKWSAAKRNPVFKEEFAKAKAAEYMGMIDVVRKAIAEGEDIPGLGDLAFAYNLTGQNLIVFWNGDRMLTLTVYGTDIKRNLEIRKAIAKRTIETLEHQQPLPAISFKDSK